MALGPGKYDDLCTYVKDQAQAAGVIVLVHQGRQGSGFSVQGTLEFMLRIPDLLRQMADQIEGHHTRGEL
jgi:hypothetical protein